MRTRRCEVCGSSRDDLGLDCEHGSRWARAGVVATAVAAMALALLTVVLAVRAQLPGR